MAKMNNLSDIPVPMAYKYAKRWAFQKRKSLLDLGCGNGRNSILFSDYGFETYALDSSPAMLYAAKVLSIKKKTHVNFIQGDMHSMPLDDSMFDCVFCYNVIYHTDSIGIKRAISELARIMKIGAEAFITFQSKESYEWKRSNEVLKVDENTCFKSESVNEKRVPHYYADKDELDKLLTAFDVIEQWPEKQLKKTRNNDTSYSNVHYNVLVRKGYPHEK